MKLWDKGISMNKKIEKFTVGNDREIDLYIAKYDVIASLAHAAMLQEVNIISKEEFSQLEKELLKMKKQIDSESFVIEKEFEDVHSKIEYELTKALGDTGKKIHTARSRNDQVLVALQLFYKENLSIIKLKIHTFFETLLALSEQHQTKFLPGYTHLQVAMPSSFGLWFSAYAELLIDDVYLLNAAIKTVDQNPLGSAAGYGSSFPINRETTTRKMEFETLKYNVIAAQLSRGKSELVVASALGSLSYTLAKFAMDITLYNSQNFGFISFPEELTTGSSIMPHKKNPDVFELIRAKCNKIQALHNEITLIVNNLPSGYHRDFQVLKENMIYAIMTMVDIIDIFNYSINEIIVHTIDSNDEKYQYIYTVDSINHLINNGMSFRDAYKQIGSEIQTGSFQPDSSIKHTHIGSINNLGLKEIRKKMEQAI